jgi:hypothetical protein
MQWAASQEQSAEKQAGEIEHHFQAKYNAWSRAVSWVLEASLKAGRATARLSFATKLNGSQNQYGDRVNAQFAGRHAATEPDTVAVHGQHAHRR